MRSLTIISLFLGLLLTEKKERKIYNPSIFFPLLWTIIFWLGQLRLYALYETSIEALNIIQVGTLSFTVGSIIWGRFRKNHRIKIIKLNSDRMEFDYQILYILLLICILYFWPSLVRSLTTLVASGGTLSAIRAVIQNAEANTGFSNFFYNFIILPLSIVSEVLGPVDFWFGKRDKKLFSLSILLMVIRVLSDAGRTPLFNFFIYMLLGFALSKAKIGRERALYKQETKQQKKKIRRYSIIAIALLTITTLSRAAGSALRITYFYFAMPNVMLSRWIDTISNSGFQSYGITSLNGLFYGISYLFKNILGVNHPDIIIQSFNYIIETDTTWLKINAQTTTANAYVSLFWFFYTDFRVVGVILGSFLFGIYMSNMFMNVEKKANINNICVFLLAFQGMFFSFIRFPFAKTYYWLAFLILYILMYRKRRN